jgi:diguanylate cyclase (GGDEF)-like protein
MLAVQQTHEVATNSGLTGAGLIAVVALVSGAIIALVMHIRRLDRRIVGLQDRLERAHIDPLTGLPSRHDLEGLHTRIKRDRLSVGYADIKYFKQVNDTHGHDDGDRALKDFAEIATQGLERGGLSTRNILRLGGGSDEFLIWGSSTKIRVVVAFIELEFNQLMAKRYPGEGVGVTIGISNYSEATTPEGVIRLAEKRMYERKNGMDMSAFEHLDEFEGVRSVETL